MKASLASPPTSRSTIGAGCVLFDLGRLTEAEQCLRRLLQNPPEQLPGGRMSCRAE